MKTNKYLVFVAVASELVVLIVVLGLLGQWLDKNYATKGLATLLGPLAGLFIWITHVAFLVKSMDQNTGED